VGLRGGERIAVAIAHLSDDKTVAKMGHPAFVFGLAFKVLSLGFVSAW
jgi:hypothetical protein